MLTTGAVIKLIAAINKAWKGEGGMGTTAIVAPLPGVVVVRGVIGVIGCVPSFSGMLALLFRIRRGRVGAD